jgi:type IX secretion system PorP/SprF family membrane protein
MKKIYLLTLLCTLALSLRPYTAEAQQDPMYSQYMFNQLAINPAYAGSWGYLTSTFLYRKQWVGMNGAPETQAASFHLPSRNDAHGFGMTLMNDKIGITQTTGLNAAYAFRIHLGAKARLALGLQGGIENYRANFGSVRTGSVIDPNTNPSDPAFNGNMVNLWLPNAGAGIFFHTKHFFLGASTPKLILHELGNSNASANTIAQQSRHFFLSTGIVLGGDHATVKFKPSVLVKFNPAAPIQFDFNAQFFIGNRLWLGATYRTEDAIVGMAQWQIFSWFRLGYAFDYITSDINPYASASHEFLLGLDLNFKHKSMISPRYF